jgi:hypothetical protein
MKEFGCFTITLVSPIATNNTYMYTSFTPVPLNTGKKNPILLTNNI